MNPNDYASDFSLTPGQAWLNVASEGPLPKKASLALQEAVRWKSSPELLTIPRFQQAPVELKNAIASLLHLQAEDVILGNSATYGLHLLANGLDFKAGDEVLLLQNDFPTDILPWLSLESKGVIVRQLKAARHLLTLDEINSSLAPKTKLLCLPYVHSFSGYKLDAERIGRLCRSRGIIFVVNLSQAAGVLDIDLSKWDADAIVCAGYKWLLGPYGTGFCWMKKELRQVLNYPQNYWVSLMDEAALTGEGPLTLKDDHSARRYDVFGTANFFNFVPWRASIEYLMSIGLTKVQAHNRRLIDTFVDNLDLKRFDLISPIENDERANIAVFSAKDPSINSRLAGFLREKGFHLALWKNKLRLSPHIYNTSQQIGGLLGLLNNYAHS